MRRRLYAVSAGVTIILLLLAVWPVTIVRVFLPRSNNLLLVTVAVDEEDRICLTYRHSVELTIVEGCFSVDPRGDFLSVQTRMESVGTGLPNTAAGRTRREDGWIVVDEKMRPTGPIRFYIMPVNQTRLKIAAKDIPVGRLKAGTLVQLESAQTTTLNWLWQAAVSFSNFQRISS